MEVADGGSENVRERVVAAVQFRPVEGLEYRIDWRPGLLQLASGGQREVEVP